MVARLKLESVSSRPPRPQTRRTTRLLTSECVVIQSNHGDRSEADLRNVSTFGCSLQSDALWLRPGLFVAIALADDWTVHAVLRWVREGRAGAEFLRPISQAEAAALAGGD